MPPPREILFEFTQVGHSVRVMAIDVDSGTEVVFQAPVNLSTSEMKTMGVKKLDYVMAKKK